ncbi:DUF1499 domain-containing protein [Prochlorococcus marinus]|uniref:Uncharacterized protein conserved in bacteria n=1 Tax=Prochlorococcus marinus (strain MIT 9211) TaxID=93059 RepID=A9BBY3_PROM4|nr:DUF1499 domain-containing protein [Prochlorococcus marinus]ABX09345.1 Uncharacterized protein conserved in bacteria [Prochlorococcus marinus str. MIT 9211]
MCFKKNLLLAIITFVFILQANPSFALSKVETIPECIQTGNCFSTNIKTKDVEASFNKLLSNMSLLPRSKLLESTKEYYHWTVKSFVFRFTDDIEAFLLSSENIIQLKSASRIGIYDFGINKQRVKKLSQDLFN